MNSDSSCMRYMYSLVCGSMDCMDLKYSSSRRSQKAHSDPHSCTGAPARISSGAGRVSGSSSSVSVMCAFSCSNLEMRRRLLTHFFHIGMGMCVDMEPEMSNCAEMSSTSTSISCAGHLATVAMYARCSTFSWRSVPFLPRLDMMSLSFFSTMSYVTVSLGAFMTSSSTLAAWPFLPTTSKPASSPSFFAALAFFLSLAVSSAFLASSSLSSPLSSSPLSESESESESDDSSSSVESIFSLAAATPVSITLSSLWCFLRRWRSALNALALVLDIFLMAGLLANMVSMFSSRLARARK
mmetsp:Transcript_1496/g.2326  ORF Transcript_1496/g.2326 Transcript_1496/m.2326 type:complete len:297 (+) Transcript_1496:1464-2354(+)